MAQGQYLSLPAAAAGLTPASSASAWAFGSWVEASSSLSTGIIVYGIEFAIPTSPAAADTTYQQLFEIGTGASSSEVTKIQIPFSYRADTITSASNGLGYWMPRVFRSYLPEPLRIDKSTRVAVRATDSIASAITYGGVKILYRESTAPTVTLSSPSNAASVGDTTPDLTFTGTDVDGDDIRYNIQVHTDNTFKPTTPTNILQEINNTDQTSVTTSSFTRVAGRLYLLSVNSKTEITADPNQPTASGTGLTFTVPTNGSEVIDNSSSSRRRLTLLYAIASSSGTGTVTVDFGGQTQTTTGVIIDEIASGFDGTTPVVQATKNNSQTAVTSISTTLSAFGNTDNITYGVFGASNGTTNPTAGSGFTSLGQARDGTEGNLGLETMYQLANDTTVDWSFSSDSELGVIGVEIKAGTLINAVSGTDSGFSGSPDNTDPFTSGQSVTYTVQSALTDLTTYYWRVRGIDPTGSNTYGSWSSTRSFYLDTSYTPPSSSQQSLTMLGIGS